MADAEDAYTDRPRADRRRKRRIRARRSPTTSRPRSTSQAEAGAMTGGGTTSAAAERFLRRWRRWRPSSEIRPLAEYDAGRRPDPRRGLGRSGHSGPRVVPRSPIRSTSSPREATQVSSPSSIAQDGRARPCRGLGVRARGGRRGDGARAPAPRRCSLAADLYEEASESIDATSMAVARRYVEAFPSPIETAARDALRGSRRLHGEAGDTEAASTTSCATHRLQADRECRGRSARRGSECSPRSRPLLTLTRSRQLSSASPPVRSSTSPSTENLQREAAEDGREPWIAFGAAPRLPGRER